jgi:alkaline phosphatase
MPLARPNSRRDFLKAASLGGLAFGAAAVPALGATTRESADNAPRRLAKNVIFMVSDGMGLGTLSAAVAYQKLVHQRESHWLRMYRELPVVRSLCETHSATGLVTDSAAAASCWGIGERVQNGALNVTPDGRKPVTLLQRMKAARKRTGLVTTATATHATPAGFVTNVSKREDQHEVAFQYLERGVDVVLGGGAAYFGESLVAAYKKVGYAHVTNRTQLLAHRGTGPLLGLFSKNYIPMEVDRLHRKELAAVTPSLAEMTQAALAALQGGDEGFFLMVEGGRIDHAGHANDAIGAILDQIAFDDAIATALRFVAANPDTLLVVTTDHGTGGLQVNGVGSEDFDSKLPSYSETDRTFLRLTEFNRSLEQVKLEAKDFKKPQQWQDLLVDATGLKFKASDLDKVVGMKTLTEAIPKYSGVGFTSQNHTGEMVEFAVTGPGAALFPPFLRNDQVHAKLLRATGLA